MVQQITLQVLSDAARVVVYTDNHTYILTFDKYTMQQHLIEALMAWRRRRKMLLQSEALYIIRWMRQNGLLT